MQPLERGLGSRLWPFCYLLSHSPFCMVPDSVFSLLPHGPQRARAWPAWPVLLFLLEGLSLGSGVAIHHFSDASDIADRLCPSSRGTWGV